METPIRVLLAKVGLDGHDRRVEGVARALREAGMDVIYTGLHRTPEEVVTTAIQEDVDVLGVRLLSGVQMTVFPEIFRLLAELVTVANDPSRNILPVTIELVKAGAPMSDIVECLKGVRGTYRENPVF